MPVWEGTQGHKGGLTRRLAQVQVSSGQAWCATRGAMRREVAGPPPRPSGHFTDGKTSGSVKHQGLLDWSSVWCPMCGW